eukprot:gene11721-5060_t
MSSDGSNFGKSPIRTFTNFLPSLEDVDSKVFLIGVSGGSASGKSTVCTDIVDALKEERVAIICQDAFYKDLDEKQLEMAEKSEFNFDHPEAFDDDELFKCLINLKNGKTVQVPQYDYSTNKRKKETTELSGATVIILEGILALYQKKIRDLMDIKIFVDTDSDTRIIRRLKRDVKERGRDFDSVIASYEKFVKPSFEEFILPTKKYADLIIPRGGENKVAVKVIIQHIKIILKEEEDKDVEDELQFA